MSLLLSLNWRQRRSLIKLDIVRSGDSLENHSAGSERLLLALQLPSPLRAPFSSSVTS